MEILGKRTNQILVLAFLLIISLAVQLARADDEEEGCGNGCQSIDPDPSQMSRCVRYACRRRVFRYFIRFGKRTGGDAAEHQRMKEQIKSWMQEYKNDQLHDLLQQRQKKQIDKQQPTLRSEKLRRVQDVIRKNQIQSCETKLKNRIQSRETNLIKTLFNLD